MSSTSRLLLVALLPLLYACGREIPTSPNLKRDAGPTLAPSVSTTAPVSLQFLPPLVPAAGPFTGTFDPDRSPVVQIVCTGATGKACPVVTSFRRVDRNSPHRGFDLRNLLPLIVVNRRNESYDALWLFPVLTTGKDKYELRVYEEGQLLGQLKLWVVKTLRDAKQVPAGYTPLVAGFPFLIRFRLETSATTPPPPPPLEPPTPPATPSCTNCLELVPGAILLPGIGAQQQLAAFQVDAGGGRTPVAATFESSNADKISVTSGGIVTAVAVLGSSQIVAHFGSQTSAPVLALIATPVAGAVLITDGQIDGGITPVDPAAPYAPGWRYHVHLKGITPSVGQVLLNTGLAAVGGKVISVTPGAGFEDVVLELLPISGMFANISINQQIPLANAPIVVGAGALQAVRAGAPRRGGIQLVQLASQRLTPTNLRRVLPTGPRRALEESVEFDLGPFECEAKVTGGLDFPISLGTASVSLNPDLVLDLQVDFLTVKRVVVSGTLAPQVNFTPELTASVEGEIECKYQLGQIVPLIGGPIAQIIGVQIPYGVGFGVGAKGEVGGMSFDAFMQATVTASFGLDCLSACKLVSEMSNSPGGFFKPSIPSLNLLRTEVSVSGFGWAELHIGNPHFESAQFDLVDVKAALQQKAELAGTLSQALDPDYASAFNLDVVLEAGNSAELSKAAGLLSISLPELKLDQEIPLGSSPKGIFTIEPSNPSPGDDTELGETATFKVTLNPATYAGIYAVDAVEIRWLKTDANGDPILEPGRPGCTSMTATPGQTEFTCQTDFLKEHEGEQTFYAFVHAKLFGVSFPLPLEIGDDAKVTINVSPYGHVHRRIDFVNGNINETDVVADVALAPSGGGFAGPGAATYHSENTTTNPAGCVIKAIFNGTGSALTVTSTGANQWALQSQIAGTHDDTNLCSGSTLSFPFSFNNVVLANGTSILRDGVLVGIDFRQQFTTATATVVATGKLKVEH